MTDRLALILDESSADLWQNGGSLSAEDHDEGPVRVYETRGAWLGVGRYDVERGAWRPVKVVRVAA
jgi:hypothetical protein